MGGSQTIGKRHLAVLRTIADYGLLVTAQLADLLFGSEQAARRCVRELTRKGCLVPLSDRLGRKRGRPQHLATLSSTGIRTLRETGHLPVSVPDERVAVTSRDATRDHRILNNWVRIHALRLTRARPEFKGTYLCPRSPFRHQYEHQDVLCIRLPQGDSGEENNVILPDGVLTLTHRPSQRSLLFYIEVDMGTESLASPSGKQNDIRTKLLNYRTALGRGHYKGCQRIVKGVLNGFRVLLVANTAARASDLSEAVRSMSPMDFVWVTDANRLLQQGIDGHIWTRGGDVGSAPQSILGSLAADKRQ